MPIIAFKLIYENDINTGKARVSTLKVESKTTTKIFNSTQQSTSLQKINLETTHASIKKGKGNLEIKSIDLNCESFVVYLKEGLPS